MSQRKSVKELRKIINKIQQINSKLNKKMSLKEREDYFFDNHNQLMNDYPFLVSQICSDSDLQMLETMLQQMEAMERGEKTKNQADTELGQQLSKEYVDPKIN